MLTDGYKSVARICALLIAVLSGFLPGVFFPVSSTTTIWNGYRILAVTPVDCESLVNSILDNTGLKGYVSESNSKVFKACDYAPIQPFLKDEYTRRSQWFSNGTHRFFYLPDNVSNRVLSRLLADTGLDWSLEEGQQPSLITPILLGILTAIFVFFSTNRIALLVTATPFIAFSYFVHRGEGFFISILALLALFWIMDLLSKGKFALDSRLIQQRLKKNPLRFLPFCPPLILTPLVSIHITTLYLAAILSSCGLYMSYLLIHGMIDQALRSTRLHTPFIPAAITPNRRYRTYSINRRQIQVVALPVIGVLVCGLILYIQPSLGFSGSNSINTRRELSLPTPTGYTVSAGFTPERFESFRNSRPKECLPDLSDFILVQWKMTIFPWISVHDAIEQPVPGETVVISDYGIDETGSITTTSRVIASFDESFIRTILKERVTPLELLLLKQGRFVSVTSTGQDL